MTLESTYFFALCQFMGWNKIVLAATVGNFEKTSVTLSKRSEIILVVFSLTMKLLTVNLF